MTHYSFLTNNQLGKALAFVLNLFVSLLLRKKANSQTI